MKTFVAILFLFGSVAFAEKASTNLVEDVNKKCVGDAEVAGCKGMKVGKGLLKCFRSYYEAHPEFKPTPDCLDAVKRFHKKYTYGNTEKKK